MLHEDDYVGSCPNCGGNMARGNSGNSDQLEWRWARQIQRQDPDLPALHSMMSRGDFGDLINENLLAAAKGALIKKESREPEK